MERRTILNSMVGISMLLVILSFCTVSDANIIYVDDSASGTNDGSSWTNAYIYLQDALTAAVSNDEIRVAHGTYTPDLGTGYTQGDRNATFQLKNGVTIKGGYVGLDISEKSDERAFNIFETILSGDLNGEDAPNVPGSSYSSKFVVTGSYTDETAVLDGFTIIGINNMGSGVNLMIESGSPTIIDCRFDIKVNSFSISNFGIYNSNGSGLTMIRCIFETDVTSTSAGGIPSNYSSLCVMRNIDSNSVLRDCIFRNNQNCMSNSNSNIIMNKCEFSKNSKTVIRQDGGNLTVEGCSFTENSISSDIGIDGIMRTSCISNSDGVLFIKDSTFTSNSFTPSSRSNQGCACIYNSNGNLTVTGSTFSSNSGGVIINNSSSIIAYNGTATIDVCVFINNSSDQLGGAISGSDFIIQNCRFSGNSASEGGAISVAESNIHNCIFEANTANKGSAISIIPNLYRELYNCTFYGNMGSGSIINNRINRSNTYTLNLTGCIIRNNESNVIEGNNINVAYCNIEGGFPGEGNVDVDPVFVRAGYWADANDTDIVVASDNPNAVWIMGDYHLKSRAGRWDSDSKTWIKDAVSSPCIDAGNINSPIGFEPFPNGGVPNMGAYGRSAEASKTYFSDNLDDVILAGDINGDSVVNYDDLYIIVSQWLLEGKDFINQPPVVTLIEPKDGDQIIWPGQLLFRAQAVDLDGEVKSVSFQIEHRTENSGHIVTTSGTKDGDDWVANIPINISLEYGTWTVSAKATDNEGAVTESKVTITLIAP
jgi:predicted outer membrane repeat protein